MARQPDWTQWLVSLSCADTARIHALTGYRYPGEVLREALNDWLERQGQPVLEEQRSVRGRPRKVAS
jgi:hypothetical protein